MERRSLVAKLNRIAKIVREKGEVSVYDIVAEMGIGISTAFQYAKLVPRFFEDIVYDRGTLRNIYKEEKENIQQEGTEDLDRSISNGKVLQSNNLHKHTEKEADISNEKQYAENSSHINSTHT